MEVTDHKLVERQIEPFFEDDLETEELAAFLEHIDHCGDCREELTIRLLIRLGLQRLEEGGNFHLGREYQHLIKNAKVRLARRQGLERLARLGVGAVLAAAAADLAIAWLIWG